MVTAFPLTPILIQTASLKSCEKMSGQKRKILSLEEHVKVVDRLAKGEFSRAISISLSVPCRSRRLQKRKTKFGADDKIAKAPRESMGRLFFITQQL